MTTLTLRTSGNYCNFVLTTFLVILVVLARISATSNRCDERKRIRQLTRCRECSLNRLARYCPPSTIPTSSGIGIRGCKIRIGFGGAIGTVIVPGCQHSCERFATYRQCCKNYWGGSCQACPGTPACSSAGKCNDRLFGNGTCSCQDGFKGTACELCKNSTMFGPGCNQTCTCQSGVCDSSVNSTGQCKLYSCQIGYTDANCNTRLPACHHSVSCAKYADCFNLNGTDTCVCEPGYTGDGKTNCTAIDPCKENSHGCHSKAKCSYLGPGKHKCDCVQGYRGDGKVCVVIDPCVSSNRGGCPKNSTVCNFLGPGKNNCSCLHGFVNFTSGRGCSMVDLCDDGNHGGCDINANCLMVKPGEKRCICQKGYRGNGTICHGNIIKRTKQLNTAGPSGVKGVLTYISLVFSHTLARALADTGPFTAFVPTDGAINSLSQEQKVQLLSNSDFTSHIVRLHLVASDLDSVALNKSRKVTTLQGTDAIVTQESGSLFYSLTNSSIKAKIIASDFVAGNGIIHVVDKVFLYPGNYSNTSTLTALEVIEREDDFSKLASFIQVTDLGSYISSLSGKVTVFAPDNSAFSFDQLTANYLTKTAKGKGKLRAIIKNHFVTGKFDITDLMSLTRLKSLEGESNTIQRKSNGAIVVGKKSQIIESSIVVKDGVIHRVNNLLIPSAVQPLVPNFSYDIHYARARGACYRCDTMPSFPNKGCPSGYTPTGGFVACRFAFRTWHGVYGFDGCRMKSCLKAIKIPKCNRGYHGSSCRPCPGPLEKPCNFHGTCNDTMRGSGACTCQSSFSGVACENCAKLNMFGPHCNQICTCIHGSCDNGLQGNGTCKPNSCKTGYHGVNCDLTDKKCAGSPVIRCHVNAHCLRENGQDICKCNAGYEGSGVICYEINPCKKPNRGGCHKDATCINTGPSTSNCSCDRGFRGDGKVCISIDPCEEGFQHRCHSNAKCNFIGPGQSSCNCKAGYTGNGQNCVEINNCLVNNGGCSPKAKCYRVGPGQHNCSCFYGYIGNGYSCFGSVATLLQDDSRFALFNNRFVKTAHLEYLLSREDMEFTVFAPSNNAVASLSKSQSDYWSSTTERLKYFVKYFLVNGTTYTPTDSLTTLNGETLNISNYDGKVSIVNGKAHITQGNITAANGIIHIIDRVLDPPRRVEPQLPSVLEALSKAKHLSLFYQSLQQTDFKAKVNSCIGCTIFAPVNHALRAYPRNLTLAAQKYHVIPKYISRDHFYNGQQFRTMLGDNYIVKLTKRSIGNAINGITFYNNAIKTQNAIIYMLSGVLDIPTRKRCDTVTTGYGRTSCRFCVFGSTCPSPWIKLRTESCQFWFFRGCRALCRRTTFNKKCCSGYWGSDCQACPGNVTTACNGNGNCSDGISGSGHCGCSANFTGTACEKCLPGKYGKTCLSNCVCVHGRCNEGVQGDGTCRCHNGWQGPNCNNSADPNKCSPKVCHRFATCRGVNSSYDCDCDAGYTGNGTRCRAINACDINNGSCHQKATCNPNPTDPSLAICTCTSKYTGDGQYCSEIDLCQTNNGGCHANATCSSIGPALKNCHCNEGYLGNGTTCKSEDSCRENHGGCSLRATCKNTAPGQRKCTCRAGYYGNGETCFGNSMEVLQNDPELSTLKVLYKTYNLDKLLASGTKTNILAPTNRALAKILGQGKRKRRGVSSSPSIQQYLRYHIIGCVRFNNYTKQTGQFVSLLGAPIWIVKNGSSVVFMDALNNTARITQGYQSANGFVFKLDAVLTPPSEYVNLGDSSKPYTKVVNELGYTTSASLLKRTGLENIFSSRFGRPYLVFTSTNQALNKLPSDLKARLNNPANIDELTSYVKYHVVHNAPVNSSTEFFMRSGGGVELRTMQGQSLFVSCKGDKGDLYVNGVSRISKRDILFDGGVAFAIDDILLPLGLGGNCDEIIHKKTHGGCGNCLSPESCPRDSTLVGTTNHNCSFDGGIVGCQPICMQRKVVRKCCKDYYGADCRACPGGLGMSCSKRGQCNDGLTGTGVCKCDSGYYGTACEKCAADLACPAPRSCHINNGGCHVFATCSDVSGTVNCTCRQRYEGDGFYCQMKDPCTVNNGGCDGNATCHFTGPDQSRCQCKQGFYELNGGCETYRPSSPCAVNHGGCSDHASCTMPNGTAVCKCWSSYTGNGVACHGNIVQTLEDTIKITAFYKALFHLRHVSEGKRLFSDLQIDSKYFTVFAPIDSAVRAKDFNLTLVENHVVSGRIKLTNTYTVANLLGSKVMIRKLDNGGFTINGVAHVLGDVQATNGVIYIVDQTLPIVGQIPATPAPTTAATTKAPSTSTPSAPPISLPTAKSSTSSSPSSSTSSSTSSSPSSWKPTYTPTEQPVKTTTKESPTTLHLTTITNGTEKPAVYGRHGRGKGISGGVVAGIVIVVLLVVLLVGGVIWYLRRKSLLPNTAFRYKRENETVKYDSDAFPEPNPSVSFNNPMYDTSEPGPSNIKLVQDEKPLPPPFIEAEHSEYNNPLYLEMEGQLTKKEWTDDMLSLDSGERPGEEQC